MTARRATTARPAGSRLLDRLGQIEPSARRRWPCVLLLAAAYTLTLAVLDPLRVSAARASPPASAKSEVEAAFKDLAALASKTWRFGDMPRWSDPAAARVMERLWDVPAILGGPPYVAADAPTLLELAERENAVYKAYGLFAPERGAPPDTAANTYRFQDEIARSGAFLLHLLAAEVQALGAFWDALPPEGRTPTRRAGAAQLRAGLIEFLTGSLIMLRAPGLRPDNRAILTDGLVQTADVIAQALPRLDRTAIGAQVAVTGAVLSPDDRARLAPVASSMSRTDCAGLCAIE